MPFIKKLLIICLLLLVYRIQLQAQYFPPLTSTTWDTLSPSALSWCTPQIDSLYAFLGKEKTKAFLVLKDGKIVLEKYYGSFTQDSLWYWASAGKSLTSVMVGIAQYENKLHLQDVSSQYLGSGWTNCTATQENAITIQHHLSMTTGLDDGVSDNHCTLDTCLLYKAPAGSRWAYHNAPYTLLDPIIENATGSTLNTYVQQKIKNITGMKGLYVPVDFDHVYFSDARSMARFGLLMLHKGVWNQTAVLPDTNYINQMLHPSQALNTAYGYLWWLNGQQSFMVPGLQTVFPGTLFPDAPADMYSAIGKNGQIINCVPSQQMVVIRMGESPSSVDVPFLLVDSIWKYIQRLPCLPNATTSIVNAQYNQSYFTVQGHTLQINLATPVTQLCVYNLMGEKIIMYMKEIQTSVQLPELPIGMYIVQAISNTGKQLTQKIQISN